ncbi:relaxase domain-containing protein [Actinacidiphila paucisporea]|uniref:relaxase domain-containing protein n=1 Tax=Actinacidiphila paucisporea TaxID=310782 RepID=UPI000D1BAE42
MSGDGSRTGNRARPSSSSFRTTATANRARGRFPQRPVGGLDAARFRHHDSRHRMRLPHDHLVVSVKVLRADGKWGHLTRKPLAPSTRCSPCLPRSPLGGRRSVRLAIPPAAGRQANAAEPVNQDASIARSSPLQSRTRDRCGHGRLVQLVCAWRPGTHQLRGSGSGADGNGGAGQSARSWYMAACPWATTALWGVVGMLGV